MQSFFDTFQKYVSPEDTLILGVSGGVDSMVLFDLVRKNHPREKLMVAHVDHSLRGSESDGDRELVASICNNENIAFEVNKIDIANLAREQKMSIEAIARQERYIFLESVRIKYNAKYILTAHHADDQVETILLNLIKGGKSRGLSGMSPLSGALLRPLLAVSKKEILTYSHEEHIPFREDSSNQDTAYERNKIRHEIVPILTSINPSLHETLGELGLYMQELSASLTDDVREWLLESERISGKEKSFLAKDFLTLTPLMQGEILSYLYAESQGGSTQGLSRGLIAELTRFIGDKGSYGKKDIKNLRMERRGERIIIL